MKKEVMKAKKRVLKPKEEIKVTITKKVLGHAPEEHSFVLHDGRKLRTVYELIDELERMNDSTFRAFVNETKNDFANWIGDVFDEKKLAKDIEKMGNRMEMQRKIVDHLVQELKKAEKKK